jgi:hypothetical protein
VHKDLQSVCTALETLATTVTNAWGADATVCENWGWFGPAVTRHDLAQVARSLAEDIRTTGHDELDDPWLEFVQDIPRRLNILQVNTVPQMFGGNSGQAIPAYLTTLALIRTQLLPALGWQAMPDSKALPANLARRARAAQAELDQLTPNIEHLGKQIEQIQAAHAVAETLPVDLQALSEAREKLSKASLEAALHAEKVKEAQESAAAELKKMRESNVEAAQLVKQCEAAYQITTTKGLAGAFDQRAGRLAWSMWTWVGGLVVALGLGSFIGAHRLELLSVALQAANPNWAGISMQAVLSLLSVGAPLWFAWLATKQVGQRFRLAEDYAFKASVAKAYEGYRKEAARIDTAFEYQLFGSALNRLDEAPLRLVESGSHGSPWHELANSEAVRRAFNAAPELQEKATALLHAAIAAAGKAIPKREADQKQNVAPIDEK